MGRATLTRGFKALFGETIPDFVFERGGRFQRAAFADERLGGDLRDDWAMPSGVSAVSRVSIAAVKPG